MDSVGTIAHSGAGRDGAQTVERDTAPERGATPQTLRIHPDDNVVIALRDLAAGSPLTDPGFGDVRISGNVRRGHKIATARIAPGGDVVRYGQCIGEASAAIAPGDHVHTHNLRMTEHRRTVAPARPRALSPAPRSFQGYRRADGRVGTRNYLGIITTVNCSGSVARFIAQAFEREVGPVPGLDGVVPIAHGTGCGMAADDEGYQALSRTLKGYANHPNFAGVLVVGLGCEVMQVPDLVGERSIRADGLVRFMTIQGTGGTRRSVERGVTQLREMADLVRGLEREEVPAAALSVGLQCGGSDAFSGLTANPALGYASDLLVALGGTTILAETPEIYGADHLLAARATDPTIAEALRARIAWWEDYTARNGGRMDNNPSPGNKRGGLTTILEKSLGAVAKGGTAPLTGVYRFAEPVRKPGFAFMDSPGYDPCSVTGQIASGANLIVFTTGRGSVSGYKPVPSIKLSTNTPMYQRMSEDMDLDCGDIAEGLASVEQKGEAILDLILRTASGAPTRSEALGFGDAEFVPWQIGATM